MSVHKHVVVTFNPEEGLFTLSFTESDSVEPNVAENRLFKIIDVRLSDLMNSGPEKAMMFIGNNVLSTIERISKKEIGILKLNQQDENLQSDIAYADALIEERANKNDPKAQEYMAIKCFNDGVEMQDVSLFDVAEEWYKKAAANGLESSIKFLKETWPGLKKDNIKRIQNNKGKGN